MIKSANQHPVFDLTGPNSTVLYRVPPYQREYSWQKPEWEALFDDLIEAEGPHFLGTIICLDQSEDALTATIYEVIDGQQRLTTLTLLMAAIYATMNADLDNLDEDARVDLTNLRRQMLRKGDADPRLTPQRQGSNNQDFRYVLRSAGLEIDAEKPKYLGNRRVQRCFDHFKAEMATLAKDTQVTPSEAAQRVLAAVNRAIIVKIEVASHADAFVLFESLNNRGVPLTPVDLIKNTVLAQAERKKAMPVEQAFARWREMLTNLGDSYGDQERFMRHYYNAFKQDLPPVQNAPVATKPSLIRIYESLVEAGVTDFVTGLVDASVAYGRLLGRGDETTEVDDQLRRLRRAQAAPSYVLVLWLLHRQEVKQVSDAELARMISLLVSFFVRRNLTGFPQTYTLPRLFMDIITVLDQSPSASYEDLLRTRLVSESASEGSFRERLEGPIYDENADVTRFVLTSLEEAKQTKEGEQDLWRRAASGAFVWTIEHVLPQGENLPVEWQSMLGGDESASTVQKTYAHRIGNLTITGYNSNLSNKSFEEKKFRKDLEGRPIGYANGLWLNEPLMATEKWGVEQIESRTTDLTQKVLDLFSLGEASSPG